MFFTGPPGSGKTQKLVDIYLELLSGSESADEILVVCSNAYRRQDFILRVRENLSGSYPKFNIYTFNGIIYNTVKDYWPLIENKIKGNKEILPYLTGLESCEFLIKECVREQNQKNKLELNFEGFYGERSLITQLIRRYRLMCENDLSFQKLYDRSEKINQEYNLQANEVLKCLKLKTSRIRVLDFVSQMNAFKALMKYEEKVQNHFKEYKHLLIDDYDEMNPAFQKFANQLITCIDNYYIALDKEGGTRRGYLSAYPDGWEALRKLKDNSVEQLNSLAPKNQLATEFFESIKKQTPQELSEEIKLKVTFNRLGMFEEVKNTLEMLIYEQEIPLDEIVVVVPTLDSPVKAFLSEYVQKNALKVQFLTGSSKPIDDPKVAGALILLQLLNPHWNLIPSPMDVRVMISGLLGFPVLVAEKIAQQYEKTYKKNPVLPNILLEAGRTDFLKEYNNFLELIEVLKSEDLSIYDQLVKIFINMVAPVLTEEDSAESYNKILDSLQDFIILKDRYEKSTGNQITERDWLLQVKNEQVADNPVVPREILPDTLIVTTPQKLVDMELASRFQLWLDVSSSAWTRTQTAALYNAWAYSKYYDESEYDDIKFTHNIAAHVLRSVIYYCQERVFTFASDLDSYGNENQGWLIDYIAQKAEKNIPQDPPTLRDDQSEVLTYYGGTMAVAAVPGAGKTYVNVAMIVKLIEEGVNPENILMLTYMDSAARTLAQRIKEIFPDLNVMPAISTIHGLAYRIIREDDNLARLGMNSDINVVEESYRDTLITQATNAVIESDDEFRDWRDNIEKGIRFAKSYNLTPKKLTEVLRYNNNEDLRRFAKAYSYYFSNLASENAIDYDDQIRLAIYLLQAYPDVKRKFQKQFRFIIEDEAQDSTIQQQKMLSILVEGHNNYIRTGDFNQAIMTTFSPVDVEGFRKFIDSAEKTVSMDHSQRSAKPIYTLANEIINWSELQKEYKNAFYNIQIKPVEGVNPQNEDPVGLKIFDISEKEKKFVADELATQMKRLPANSTFAVLTRTNFEAIQWTRYLDEKGFKCICFTDSLEQKKIFNLVFNFLKVIHKPYDNRNIRQYYGSLVDMELLNRHYESEGFIEKLGSPFVSFKIEELPSSQLIQFYTDIFYWLENSDMPVSELIMKYVQEVFTDPINKSNGFILSLMVERFRRDSSNKRYKKSFYRQQERGASPEELKVNAGLPEVIEYFKGLSKKKKLSGYRFFDDEENIVSKAGFVQIMTVHKSKGMGFDMVCVPHIWDDTYSYPSSVSTVRLSPSARLELQLKQAMGERLEPEKYFRLQKVKQVEENLRLLYVAVTRAKRLLYLTSSRKGQTNYGKLVDKVPSQILEYLINKQKEKLMESITIYENI